MFILGIQWTLIEKNTRLQRLIGAFSNESLCWVLFLLIYFYKNSSLDYVWALTTDKMICSSNGQTLEKPRQAQYLTHATFVPDNSSHGKELIICILTLSI